MGIVIRIDVDEREQLNFKVWNDGLSNSVDCCQSKVLANFNVTINKQTKRTNETDITVEAVPNDTSKEETENVSNVENTSHEVRFRSVANDAPVEPINDGNNEESLEEYFVVDKIVGNRFNPLTKQYEFLLRVKDCQPVNNAWKPISDSRSNSLPEEDGQLYIQKSKYLAPLKHKFAVANRNQGDLSDGSQSTVWSAGENVQPEQMDTEPDLPIRNIERLQEPPSHKSFQDLNVNIKCEPVIENDEDNYDYDEPSTDTDSMTFGKHVLANCNAEIAPENASYADSVIPNPYACNLCGRTFSGIQYLRKHEKIHTKSTIFTCSVCSFAFSNLHLLSVHERNTHGIRRIPKPRGAPPGPRKRPAEQPGPPSFANQLESPSSQIRVSSFAKTYESEMTNFDKPFKCQLCIRTFRNQHALTLHEGVHNDGRLFTCTVCDRVFTYLHALKNHERTHLNVKPVPCCFCGKLFTMESRRKLHERKHRIDFKNQRLPNMIPVARSHDDTEKPYFCRFCPKAFRLKHTLVVHTRTHTGEKPFACHLCDYRSSQKISLDCHMRKHEKSWMQNSTY